MIYVYLGIIAPILLNALHALIGVLILKNNHSVTSLGFTGISFLTKSIGLLFLTWFGIKVLELDFKIYVHFDFSGLLLLKDSSFSIT